MNTTIFRLGLKAYYPNMGAFDRNMRYLVAASLMLLLHLNTQMSALTAMLIVLITVPLVTSAIVRWDPVYGLFDINTRETVATRKDLYDNNVSLIDTKVRYILGVALIVTAMLAASTGNPWVVTLALVAIPVIMTAIIKWDPIYALFPGFSTIPLSETDSNVIHVEFGPDENPSSHGPVNYTGNTKAA